jgi:hypothetical protein
MGLVMLRKQDLAPRDAEVRRDDAAHPDLFAERVLHRLRERAPRARERTQRTHQDPLELQHRALIEDHRVERLRLEAGLPEAPLDRRQRERGVALAP